MVKHGEIFRITPGTDNRKVKGQIPVGVIEGGGGNMLLQFFKGSDIC